MRVSLDVEAEPVVVDDAFMVNGIMAGAIGQR